MSKEYDCNGEPITRCDVCGKVIRYGYIRRKQHMTSKVMTSLNLDSVIPDLCSEKCCDIYAKIRSN